MSSTREPDQLPAQIANEIYDVLVEHAGAPPSRRAAFVHAQTQDEHKCIEYRFGGHLGFGGKFWRNGHWYVNCYREDETPLRIAVIEETNRALNNVERRAALNDYKNPFTNGENR